MLKVALTGGIGSGKSTVAERFAAYGIPVLDADLFARELTAPSSPLLPQLIQHFGTRILQKGQLDRKQLRTLIFNHPEHKQWLENLLHPHIRQKMREQLATIQAPYVILVIPLLAEAKQRPEFIDRICVVDSPEALQITRASQRDQLQAHHIKTVISQQSSRRQRLALADDVIINEGCLETLYAQVDQLHLLYSKLSQNSIDR